MIITALLAGVVAAVSDFRGMRIPNFCPLIIIVCFIISFLAVTISDQVVFAGALSHLASGAIVFSFTYMLFAFGVFGAGDSKLVTAFGFWAGLQGLPVLIFYVTIAGAVLALVALVLLRFPVSSGMSEESWIARLRARDRVVPYGIAIAFGAVAAFYHLGYFGITFQ